MEWEWFCAHFRGAAYESLPVNHIYIRIYDACSTYHSKISVPQGVLFENTCHAFQEEGLVVSLSIMNLMENLESTSFFIKNYSLFLVFSNV